MTHPRRSAGFAAVLCLSIATASQADPVIYWNEVTLAAVTVGRAGPSGLLDIALVHAAVHDAVQAIEGKFEPFQYDRRSKPVSGSAAAAAAAAAHRVLVLLYPAQQANLDATYAAYLAEHGLNGDAGLAIGEAAAAEVHLRHYRPVLAMAPNFGIAETGQWRSATPFAFFYAAFSQPFTLKRINQFRPAPPPRLGSRRYAREYDEVKLLGDITTHPNDATEMARFWSVNFVAQWNEAVRQIAANHLQTIGDRARLFALTNLAAADAFMATWDSKYFYNYWRPSTAIRQGDEDGNPRTVGDAAWTGLIADPAYPDYVSGANGLTGAFTGMLRLFFHTDDVPFSVKTTSPLVVNKERHFERFSEAAQEVVEARILLGIHFRSADEEGRRLGNRVARWTFANYLRERRDQDSTKH